MSSALTSSPKTTPAESESGVKLPVHQPVIVAMIDGLDPRYATEQTMPTLSQFAAKGTSAIVDGVSPSVTNANNAGISCASWPSEHGITGNYFFDPTTGEQDYMESSRMLLRPTLMTRIVDAGGKAALLTAKKKTVSLLGDRSTLAIAAEDPPREIVDRYGAAPQIYSAEINHWLWSVAADLLRTRNDLDLIYVHTTDFPMHAWRPGDPRSDQHLTKLDALIGDAVDAAPDAALFVTADHGMNDKTLVYDLNQALCSRGTPVRLALSAEKDKYVRHHRTFGGTAWVWLNDPREIDAVIFALRSLPGVESVIDRDTAAAEHRLHPDRIGDLMVLGDMWTVFGDLAPGVECEVLPEGYRTHGSMYETRVPLIAYNNESLPYSRPPRHNKDLLQPVLQHWLTESR
jgi:phosphonoacetate hydrolase